MANIAVLKRGEVCPMPYALCPMPYALCPMPYALCPMPYALCQIVPHVTEKGYTSMFLIIKKSKLWYGI